MNTKRYPKTTGFSTVALLTAATLTACAQDYPRYTPGYSAPIYVAPPVAVVQPPAAPQLSEAQLDALLAPIALYPDPLLAQVLPAATYPLEIVNAARWLQAYPTPDESIIEAQAWEPSIKAIVHYPTVLKQMNDNLDWTQALGVAFLNQPADVMESIQRLRRQAQIVGSLQSNQQQQVLIDGNTIQILPADPQIIYVPLYDPEVVYAPQPVANFTPLVMAPPPLIVYYSGIRIGLWLDNDFDWDHHWIAIGGGWHQGWRHDDHGWTREPHDTRPPVSRRPDDRGAPEVRTWTHNPAKAPPVMPPALRAMARPTPDPHRGFPINSPPPTAAPGLGRENLPINIPRPAPGTVRPSEQDHRVPPPVIARPAEPIPVRPHPTPPLPVAPAPAHAEPKLPPPPTPTLRPVPDGAFNGYQSRGTVQQNVQRAQESQHAPTPPAAPPLAPAPPHIIAPSPPPRVQAPPPTPMAPPPRPAAISPAPPRAAPEPMARPTPPSMAPSPPPRMQAPAPPPAPAQPAFRNFAPAADVQQQSARGHDSLKGSH